jgi:hypothetical protein
VIRTVGAIDFDETTLVDGIVVEKHVVRGQMTEPGERLYRLADLALV